MGGTEFVSAAHNGPMSRDGRDTHLEHPGVFRLFSGLSPAGRRALADGSERSDLADGEVIQFPARHMDTLAVVVSGSVSVVHSEPGGQRRIVRILGPGDFVGETELLLGHTPLHTALAAEPSTILTLGHALVEHLIETEHTFCRAMLSATTERLLAAELLLAATSAGPVGLRIARYLLALRPGPGDEVALPAAQVDVSSYLGTTPETLSRTLAVLEKSGAIRRVGYRSFALDRARLHEYVATAA